MLSRGGILSIPYPSGAVVNISSQSSNSCFLCHSFKIHGGHFSSIILQRRSFLSRVGFGHLRYDLSVSSTKRSNDTSHLEIEGFVGEDEWEDDDDVDGNDGDDDDDVDDEIDVQLMDMKNWLKNKPSGFGDGKVYDTSIEDKMFDEMEQSRQAQLLNKNKLKSEVTNPNVQKVAQKQKAKEEELPIQPGIRVRLINLPKKKNIHRDLQLAFKGVPGILNIVPAVDGNKKTRDPICKGIAFVYLHSEAHAKKFVQLFSEQDISFGKIQKKIVLEIVNPNSPKSNDYIEKLPVKGKSNGFLKLPVKEKSNAPQLPSSSKGGDTSIDFESDAVDIPEEDLEAFDFSDNEDDNVVNDEEIIQTTATISRKSQEPKRASPKKPVVAKKKTQKQSQLTIPGSSKDLETLDFSQNDKEIAQMTATISRKPEEPKQASPKKPVAKKKAQKQPQLNIPGSANRLKFKEKAVLTGVFSKYGGQAQAQAQQQAAAALQENRAS